MDKNILSIIEKAQDGTLLDRAEIIALLSVENLSPEAFAIQQAGRAFTESLNDGYAEIHSHIGLDASPCPCDCAFCSFAASAGIFRRKTELPLERILDEARTFDADGVNALYLVTTARYDQERFLEVVDAVRGVLTRDIPIVANIADFDLAYARELKAAGVAGAYHVMRLGEGTYTRCDRDARIATIEAAKEAGLAVGNCIEPIGPEHTPDELADLILLARSLEVGFSGAMRRNTIPNTAFSKYGNISYGRLATYAGAIALATGPDIRGNCTHEPSQLCAQAGANVIWAERGTSPRDTTTETLRGYSVGQCRELYAECDWKVWEGPSRYYA